MKKSKALAIIFSSLLGIGTSYADSTYVMRAPSNQTFTDWVSIDSIYGTWSNSRDSYDCGSYYPSPSLSLKSNYVQSSNCSQDQVKTIQEQKYDNLSGKTKVTGSYTDHQPKLDLQPELELTNGFNTH